MVHRNGYTKASADAIWVKMQSSGFQPAAEELLSLKLPGYFIDCKCSPTSVVGGGPAEDGACRPLGRRCQSGVLQWLEIGTTWPEAPNWLVFFYK